LNLIRVMPAKGQDLMGGNSVYLARLIGPVMAVVGVGVFVNAAIYRVLADEFLRSRALIYLSGLILMTAGLAIVLTHNVWAAGWTVIITLLGWLATVGGAIRIIMPQGAETIGRRMLKSPMNLKLAGAVWLALGAILCFFGYVR
jgi:uncharacterized membrane protein